MPQVTRQAIWAMGLLCLLGQNPVHAGNISLPDLGDESLAVISPAQERKLGEDLMRQSRRALAFVDDPELNSYIQSLGQKLVSHADTAQQDFRFFIIDNSAINAFAVPGGFIGVHTGLILAAQNEAELASVLAHETAHITQRHIPRLITESQRTSLPAMAAILAGILLASSGHQGGEAAIALTGAAVAQKEINYTRSFEEEADRIGMQILARSGFDPRAMPAFFERMQNLNRVNETNLPEFLRTHPVTTNRIADSRNRAEQLPYRQVRDGSEFEHMRAKIRALAPGNPQEIARGFKDEIAQGKFRNADAERYGYVVALLRANQLVTARTEVQKLLAQSPNKPAYRILQAEVEMAAQNYKQALTLYANAYAKAPSNAMLMRYYANALLQTNHYRQAKDLLKSALQQQPDDPTLYKMLAEAAGGTGASYEAHRALAESYYLNGDAHAALEQLQLAARFTGDNFYLQSSLEARMASIKDDIALYQKK
ncbi:MAG: M48 family metallopeptidase [Gammaproteobacteria bacterium]|nr:M48 family metallopeptidase [Gammaproteobacteria bacterium]